jgi:hypothetical protein
MERTSKLSDSFPVRDGAEENEKRLMGGCEGFLDCSSEDVTDEGNQSTITEVLGNSISSSSARRTAVYPPKRSPVFALIAINPDGTSTSEIVLERYSKARWRSWRQVERNSQPSQVTTLEQAQRLDSVLRVLTQDPVTGSGVKADKDLISFLTAKVTSLETKFLERTTSVKEENSRLAMKVVNLKSRIAELENCTPWTKNSIYFEMPSVPTIGCAEVDPFKKLLRRRALVETHLADTNAWYAQLRHDRSSGISIKESQDRLSSLRSEFKKLNQAVDFILQNPCQSVAAQERAVLTPVCDYLDELDGKWFRIKMSCIAGDKTPSEDGEETEG